MSCTYLTLNLIMLNIPTLQHDTYNDMTHNICTLHTNTRIISKPYPNTYIPYHTHMPKKFPKYSQSKVIPFPLILRFIDADPIN